MAEQKSVLNDRYLLLERAGSGGMSTVYRARDELLGRIVAVKVLHESLTSDTKFLERFQKEAHAAANLTHPNIVTVHDIGQDGRRYYIVMEYVEGWTLKEVIRQHMRVTDHPLPLEQSLEIAIQVCAGIGYAHRANVVHCDVKSQNVLVGRDRRVKVTDFGIARALSEASVHDPDIVWGTPQYFSPEQAAGESATPASDVYSIGVIMFEMLTGRLPFEAENHTALALKHIQESPALISQYNPAVPDQIVRIVNKVLSKEPAGRYRTADQLGRVLSTYRESTKEDTGPLPHSVSDSTDLTRQSTLFVPPPEERQEVALALLLNSEKQDLPQRYMPPATAYLFPEPANEQKPDWTAIILGIIALISLLGLIPLWYLVYLQYTG